ncbi:hypothetical protein BT93_L5333 [Corymbia citriodora subsp. variegata]|uniref:Probable glucan endo-1,3-beta-glucosidase eglC n=1 Tax=Corymbia citriodora subsp. variegata TaxID=360336 RepID=A0A8T0CF93_CORYI|nr:hypothetical protein BT93_L5333 [Corymbia citriodora subsp. variegata]
MRFSTALSLVTPALAATKGFNYGSTFSDGTIKHQSDFQGEFTSAQNLVGTSGFNSARLYTMIQGDTGGVIEAIPAAIATGTTLLLGLWASAGQADFNNEVAQLVAAANTYGSSLADLVVGISVGSEDIYRVTPLGVASNAGPGLDPEGLVNYINQVRGALAGTPLASAMVGHVDTYNTWINTTWTQPLIDSVDFLGVDAYPYYESTKANSIDNSMSTFWDDFNQVVAVAGSKGVWVTETGWPNQGPTSGQAVASIANAETYWQQTGCSLFAGNVMTWWFTLQDQQPVVPSSGVVFAVTGPGNPPPTTPLYDLSCSA